MSDQQREAWLSGLVDATRDRLAAAGQPVPRDEAILSALMLSLDPPPDRSPTDSASTLVDTIISHGAAAGVKIADRVRRQILAQLSKKNSPPPRDSTRPA